MAYTLNRRLAELIDSNGQLATGKIATGYISTAHFASNSITDAKLHSTFALPASALSGRDTGDLSEGSNQYFTNARADARIAAADTGDLSEGSNLYYTDARVGTYISGNRTFGNITTTGYIAGPASMVIDPAGVGDNTGTVVIAGNLQVDGTTTTINSTTVSIDDLNFTIASDAADSSAANGAGITIGGASATMLYTHATTSFDFNKPVNVGGALKAGLGTVSLPGLSFTGDPNTGLYRPSADNLGFAIGGTARAFMSNTQFNVATKIVATELDINGNADISGTITTSGNVSVGGSAYTTSTDLNLLGDGLSIKNDKAGSSNNWSLIQNTDTGSASNLSFTTGLGVALTLNHNKSSTFTGDIVAQSSVQVFRQAAGAASVLLQRSGAAGPWSLAQGNTATNYFEILEGSNSRLTIKNGGNVGIGETSPNAFLSVRKDNNNSGNQFIVADTEGTSPGVRTYTHGGDDSGLILNHYYALGGSGNEYMRYADFVANVGNGAGTTMRFITKNAANVYSNTVIDNDGNLGIGIAVPVSKLHLVSANVGVNGAVAHILQNVATNGPTLLVEQTGGGGNTNVNHGLLVKVDGQNGGFGNALQVIGTNNNLNSGNDIKALTVKNGGNVGIGTDTPDYQLHIAGGGDFLVEDTGNGSAHIRLRSSSSGTASSNWKIKTGSNNYLYIENDTAGTTDIAISDTGKVGIGENAPASKLDVVSGVSRNAGGTARFGKREDEGLFLHSDASSTSYNWMITTQDTVNKGFEIIPSDSAGGTQFTTPAFVIIADTGRVGMGTSDPGCSLDVTELSGWAEMHLDGESGGDLILKDNGVSYGEMYAGNGHGMVLKSYASQDMYFLTNANATAKMVIQSGGNVAINHGLGGGGINSKFNVFADGEALRLDGTANTSRTLRFRNTGANGSSNAVITSDGILQIKTEDANAHIYINSVRDIDYQTTSLNGTAGDHIFSSYNTEIMRLDGGNNRISMGGPAGGAAAKLHIDGATSSQPALMLEGNTNGDVIALQFKAKANNGTLSYHGLTANPGSDQDDNTISLGNGGGNGVVVDHKNVVQTRYSEIHSGGTFAYDTGGNYLGANGAGFGTHAIFRTPSVTSPTNAGASTQFLTVYSSGHWGEYPVCRFRLYTTYFSGGYREYLFRQVAGTSYLTEVQNNGTSSSWGTAPGTITKGSTTSTGQSHSGQTVYRTALTFTSTSAYYRNYVVTEIMYGANRYYSSANSQAQIDALSNLGGKYHFKTISLAESRGKFTS